MGQPIKDGIDYFPLDVDMDETEEKIFVIEAECENERGFGMLIKLLMRIYRGGYFLKWNDRVAKIFAKRKNLDIDKLNSLVEVCVREDFFDKGLFDKYSILTSHGIQKRYFKVASRRSSVDCVKEYLLVNIYDYIKKVNVNILPVNVNNNRVNVNNYSENVDCEHDVNNYSENADIYSTRKEVKEVKEVKESKVKEGEEEMLTSSSSLKKPPPEEYDAGIKSLKGAVGALPQEVPGKSKDEQLREVAARLKEEKPEEYEKLVEKHPELQEAPRSKEVPW